MDKKSNVDDIFQNDNNSKNKTKTILLLVIVAIILIAVFLIIAWVMTRENPMQTIQDANNTDTKVVNSPLAQNPIPYAHNLGDGMKPNEALNTNDTLGLDTDNQNSQNMGISTLPPLGVKVGNDLATNTQSLATKPITQNNMLPNYQNDPNFQRYNELEKQEQTKKEGNDEHKQSEVAKIPPKIITPLPPKEIPIATAPDPTKARVNTTQKPKESANIAQKQSNPKDTKSNVAHNTQSQQDNKSNKSNVKDVQKDNAKSKPPAQTPKPSASQQVSNTQQNDSKIIQRPVKLQDKNQGTEAGKGFYIQVGSFAQRDKIDQKFLDNIAEYSYRTKTETTNGVTSVKYLIGPYKERTESKRYLQDIKTKINPHAFFTEVK